MDGSTSINAVNIPQNNQPIEETSENCPICCEVFSRNVTVTTCCSNNIDTNCLKLTLLNTPLGERKVCPLCRGDLSDLAESWGIVVRAERTTNQERQINTLPPQELQPQQGIIQGTGATLTGEAQSTLSKKMKRAIDNGFYDTAGRLQGIIQGTGATLTGEAQSALSKKMKLAIDDEFYDTAERLQGIIQGTGATLTGEAQSALSKKMKLAIDDGFYDTAERLQGIIQGTGTTLKGEGQSALHKKMKWAIDNELYDTAKRLQGIIQGTGAQNQEGWRCSIM